MINWRVGGVVCALALSGTQARADSFFPSLPPLESIAAGVGVDEPQSSATWKSPSTSGNLSVEVAVLLSSSPPLAEGGTLKPPYDAVVAYAGTLFGSSAGGITETLRASASIRDTYLGVRYQHRFDATWGVFAGADFRFVSFDSGRVYENDPMRTVSMDMLAEG